jgi:nitronate monooxygenase
MPLRTRATELLGIEHPIVVGGLTGVGTVELAAAVSNAGGLGIFTAHNAGSPDGARAEIRRLKTLTSRPFGVNLTILPTIGAPPPYEEYARVFIEEGVKVVETAGSNPKKWVELFKAADPAIVCIHKCVAIRHALKAEKLGVDIISLDGFECAGHPGEDDVGNFVLQAKGAKVLRKPYLCSGGVANGRQLAAALALGAAGVNCGTRFCVTKEGNWPREFKERVVTAEETHTVLMFRALHNTARAFRNEVTTEVERIQNEKGSSLEFGDIMHLVTGARGREAEKNGDPDGGVWSAGQSIGLIDDIPSCQEVVAEMVADAESIIRGELQRLVVDGARARL